MTELLQLITVPFLISTIFTLLISIVLLWASYEDIMTRTIRAVWVVVLYILVSVQSVATNNLSMQSTYLFLFSLGLFLIMALLSRGQFGIGDALVIGALAWYYHSFEHFQIFLYTMAIIGVPWAIYWSSYYKKKYGYKSILTSFKSTISIDEVQPGMVLSEDNFMNGLNEKDIQKMKDDGKEVVSIKQPFAFIPVICFAFIITLFI